MQSEGITPQLMELEHLKLPITKNAIADKFMTKNIIIE